MKGMASIALLPQYWESPTAHGVNVPKNVGTMRGVPTGAAAQQRVMSA